MPGEAHHVNAQGVHINGEDPRRLGGIQKEEEAVLPGEAAYPLDVHRVPCQVGGMGADHGFRLRPEEPFKPAVIQVPPFAGGDEIHRRPLLPEAVEGPENGVVLQVRGENVVPGPQQAADGGVQGLGGVLGETHVVRPGAAQEGGGFFPGFIDGPGGGQGPLVGSPAAVAVGGQGLQDGPGHGGGLGPGGGGVVQVDHGLTTLPAPASFSTMLYMLVTPPTASWSVRP